MKDPRWKQADPFDQMTVILMSLEGSFDNWFNGIYDNCELDEDATDAIKQLKALQPFLRQGSW